MQRDKYLDFYRGIAIISVMFIHTTFQSGVFYIPDYVRSISLLLDVPFFMFLSGWSAWYSHNPKRVIMNIFNICKKWIFFLILINIILILINKSHLNTLTDWITSILFIRYPIDALPTIGASLWYMPIYFIVLFAGMVLINFFIKFRCSLSCCFSIIIFFLIGLCYLSFDEKYLYAINKPGGGYFGLSEYFCFYIICFLLGYLSKGYRIKNFFVYCILCIVNISLWFLSSRAYGTAARNLQAAKFPPQLMYFFASQLSICSALYLKGRINRFSQLKCIRSIGENAIFYYFAQGLGASVLYKILPQLSISIWYVKMLIAFILNVLISICCAKILIILYGKFQRIFNQPFILSFMKNIRRRCFEEYMY